MINVKEHEPVDLATERSKRRSHTKSNGNGDGNGFEKWRQAGLDLCQRDSKLSWAIGDWWNDGEPYGDRVAFVQSDDWTGPTHDSVANYGSVAKAFDPSHRIEGLSFSHHMALASMDDKKKRASLIKWALAPAKDGGKPMSVVKLRAEIARRNTPEPKPTEETTEAVAKIEAVAKTEGDTHGEEPTVEHEQEQEQGNNTPDTMTAAERENDTPELIDFVSDIFIRLLIEADTDELDRVASHLEDIQIRRAGDDLVSAILEKLRVDA